MLMLSARGTEYDKLFGFEVDIDDYVVKPFSPKELMARIRVIIHRHQPQADAAEKDKPKKQMQLGALCIDPLGRNVWVDGTKVDLTTKEYDLLLYFYANMPPYCRWV